MDLKQYTTEKETAVNLARRLRIPSTLISQWQTGVRRTPAERCPDIERETGGVVTCEELRPDVDWAVLRTKSAVNAENKPNPESSVALATVNPAA